MRNTTFEIVALTVFSNGNIASEIPNANETRRITDDNFERVVDNRFINRCEAGDITSALRVEGIYDGVERQEKSSLLLLTGQL